MLVWPGGRGSREAGGQRGRGSREAERERGRGTKKSGRQGPVFPACCDLLLEVNAVISEDLAWILFRLTQPESAGILSGHTIGLRYTDTLG